MEWYPLFNTLRVALIAAAAALVLGVPAAWLVQRLPRPVRTVLDVILSLPIALPPTVTGWLLISLLGAEQPLGQFFHTAFDLQLTLTWWSAVFPAFLAAFPFLYRTVRRAFSSFDEELADAARTLGRSNLWAFWRLRLPACRRGILAGLILAFVRAVGEYGATSMVAGYTHGRTATISTTVYQLWRGGMDDAALPWVLVSLCLSVLFLAATGTLDGIERGGRG